MLQAPTGGLLFWAVGRGIEGVERVKGVSFWLWEPRWCVRCHAETGGHPPPLCQDEEALRERLRSRGLTLRTYNHVKSFLRRIQDWKGQGYRFFPPDFRKDSVRCQPEPEQTVSVAGDRLVLKFTRRRKDVG